MADTQTSRALLRSIAPRIAVGNLEQTLAFYGQLGFVLTDQWGEGFAIIARDGIDLHLHPSDEPATHGGVFWMEMNTSEVLYQKFRPTSALASPLAAQPWGFTEFSLHDPFGNLIIVAERSAEKEQQPIGAGPTRQPLLRAIAPRLLARDLSQALAFYAQLGFATTYQDEEFAIVERDRITLHFNVSDGHSVCWVGVTNIEALYQEYLPTNAIPARSTGPTVQPWGMKEFHICDPFRNLILFGEEIADGESDTQQEA